MLSIKSSRPLSQRQQVRGRARGTLTTVKCGDDSSIDVEFSRQFHAYIAQRQELSAATMQSLNEFVVEARAARPMLPVGAMTWEETRADHALITG